MQQEQKNTLRRLVAARTAVLLEQLQRRGLDTAVILKPENVFYYSNFNPVLNSHPAIMLVSAKHGACLLVHSLRRDHAAEEGAVDNLQLYGKWGANVALAMEPVAAIREILGGGPLRLGVEMESMSVNWLENLKQGLAVETVEDISLDIKRQKIVKDAWEIENIRHAARLVDAGVETTIAFLKEGYSEADACTEGQYRMRRLWTELFPDAEVCGYGTSEGGMVDSLHVWCLSNGHIAYGCDCPRHYRPGAGDLTLPMAWAKVNGYHAENERTLMVGQVNPARERAYHAMLEARAAVFERLRPGTTFSELFVAATEVYTRCGFGDILPGRVGHGVGNSGHEFPSLDRATTIELAPGMVITVEPGLMETALGGVRHSDTVLITADGFERLTLLDNGLLRIEPPTPKN